MQARPIYPEWPTALYVQSVAIYKPDTHEDTGCPLSTHKEPPTSCMGQLHEAHVDFNGRPRMNSGFVEKKLVVIDQSVSHIRMFYSSVIKSPNHKFIACSSSRG